jgi:hypothetical protein
MLVPVLLVAQQRDVRAAPAAADVAIRLWVPAGLVEVQGWDHDSVDVRATASAGSSFGGGGTRSAMKFSFESRLAGDTALAGGQVRVRVPRHARVWIKSTTAGITVSGVSGEVDAITVTGAVEVLDGRGVVRVEALAAPVTLRRVDGAVRIRGGDGVVTLDGLSGTVDASTVGGGVTVLKNTILDRAAKGDAGPPLQGSIETISGRVAVMGSLGPAGRLEIRTHDGPVALTLVGMRAPRVTSGARGAVIDAALREGSPEVGDFVVHTFKGTVNARFTSGI